MDTERIRRAALGRKAADVDRRMKRRLVVYLVLITIIGLWYLIEGRQGPRPEAASEPLAPPEVEDVRREPTARIDPARLAGVRDATRAERALLESDARLHLLEQASRLIWGDLEKLGLRAGDWDELSERGAELRGEPVWALGTLEWMDSETIDRLYTVRCEIRDEAGRSWAALVVTEPWDIAVGDVVRVSGFFFKNYELRRPDGSFVTAPLIVGEELLRSAFRIDPVTHLDPETRQRVRDFDLTQASQPLDSPEFYEFLSYARHAADEDLVPPGEELPEVIPTELLDRERTAYFRGRAVSVTGVLIYARRIPLGPRGENPLGIPFVWQLWVSDNRAGEAGSMLVYSLDPPEGIAEGEIVDVTGVYFRRWAFENKLNHSRLAAVIFARSVEHYVPPESTFTPLIGRIILTLVGALVLLVVIGQWRERTAASAARSRRLKRTRELVKRPGLLHRRREDGLEAAADGPDGGADG